MTKGSMQTLLTRNKVESASKMAYDSNAIFNRTYMLLSGPGITIGCDGHMLLSDTGFNALQGQWCCVDAC